MAPIYLKNNPQTSDNTHFTCEGSVHTNVFIEQELDIFMQNPQRAQELREKMTPEILARVQKMEKDEDNLNDSLSRLNTERQRLIEFAAGKKPGTTESTLKTISILDKAIERTHRSLETSKRMKDEVVEWLLSCPYPQPGMRGYV